MNRLVVDLPYEVVCSKNKAFGVRGGRIYSTGVKKQSLKHIENITRTAMHAQGTKFEKRKIWLSILVEKPHHRGDAVNVVDVLCDGLKKGIDVDDKWFSISKLDWTIIPDRDCKIIVELVQN